jgi:phosphatidylinositol glycan class W
MDMGVGSFVFSLGVVSTRAFTSTPGQSRLKKLARSLYKATPLILLGLVRVIMVKGVEYPVSIYPYLRYSTDEQEHITEYGVHWNFFFTLAMLPVFGTALWPIRRNFLRWSAIAVMLGLGE